MQGLFQGVNQREGSRMQLGSGKPQCPLMSNKLRLGPRKRRGILGRGWAPGIPTSMLAVLKPSLAANLDSLAWPQNRSSTVHDPGSSNFTLESHPHIKTRKTKS